MEIVLGAVYRNGTLILDRDLGAESEGKKYTVVLKAEESIEAKKERFFRMAEKHAFTLPEDYRFDREEIYG